MCVGTVPECVTEEDLAFLMPLAQRHYALMLLDMTRRLSVAEDQQLDDIERQMAAAVRDRFGVLHRGLRCRIDPIYDPACGGPGLVFTDAVGNCWRRELPRGGQEDGPSTAHRQGKGVATWMSKWAVG